MKTMTRIVAVLMAALLMASIFVACGDDKKEEEKESYKDTNIIGTWKETDEKNGDQTWTFNDDFTCTASGRTTGSGTYFIESEDSGKIRINLDSWGEEKMCTYTVTPKAIIIESMDDSFYGSKQ